MRNSLRFLHHETAPAARIVRSGSRGALWSPASTIRYTSNGADKSICDGELVRHITPGLPHSAGASEVSASENRRSRQPPFRTPRGWPPDVRQGTSPWSIDVPSRAGRRRAQASASQPVGLRLANHGMPRGRKVAARPLTRSSAAYTPITGLGFMFAAIAHLYDRGRTQSSPHEPPSAARAVVLLDEVNFLCSSRGSRRGAVLNDPGPIYGWWFPTPSSHAEQTVERRNASAAAEQVPELRRFALICSVRHPGKTRHSNSAA